MEAMIWNGIRIDYTTERGDAGGMAADFVTIEDYTVEGVADNYELETFLLENDRDEREIMMARRGRVSSRTQMWLEAEWSYEIKEAAAVHYDDRLAYARDEMAGV